jgi:hypothetical protein
MITTLLTFLGSPIIGSAIGFLGSWAKDREDRKRLELKYNHTLAMAEVTAKNTREELSLKGEIAETQSIGKAFEASQLYGNQNVEKGFVNAVRGLVRPLITTYLLAATTYFAYSIHGLLGGFNVLSPDDMMTLYREVIISLLALTNMAVAYWFGSRKSNNKDK